MRKIKEAALALLLAGVLLVFSSGTSIADPIVEYYASGNLKTYYDGWNTLTFEDSNYYDVSGANGQGRLIRWESTQNGDTNFNEFEYYGNTLNLKSITAPTWYNNQIIPGSLDTETFYNEDYIDNPKTATDSSGNVLVAALIFDVTDGPKACVIKYDPAGNILWKREFSTNTTIDNVVVAVDKNDNVFLAATKWTGSDSEIAVYGYMADGQSIGSWQFNYGINEEITNIAVDPDGNIIISGKTGDYDARDLFVAKVKADLTGTLWTRTFDSGGKDYGGYITVDSFGNITLHGDSETYGSGSFKVVYDTDGTASPVVYDPLEMYYGSSWLGAWNVGRSAEETRSIGGINIEDRHSYAYIQGTGKSIIAYESDMSDILGGGTMYGFYDSGINSGPTAFRIEFDSGDIAEYTPIDDNNGRLTKFTSTGGSTYWFLWGDATVDGNIYTNVLIEYTGGIYNAYIFTPDTANPENMMNPAGWTLIGQVSDPGSLVLPELGDWLEWAFTNFVIPEFPPVSSDFYQDEWGYYRYDYNDYLGGMTTEYDYWVDLPDSGEVWMDVWIYDDAGNYEYKLYSKVYNYGDNPDPANMDNWEFLYEINYDMNGIAVRTLFANGDFIFTTYYESGNKYVEDYINAQGAWQKSIVYYDANPSVMFQQYLSDPNPGTPGDAVFYEYDSQGRMSIKRFDNNDFIVTLYWDAPSNNKKHEIYFGAGNVWQKTFEYYDVDNPVIHYQWAADTEIPDEITFEEYNNSGRILRRNYDDGRVDVHEYYESGNKHFDVFFNSGIWLKSIEYFDSSNGVIYRQWMVDTDLSDEVIFEEYNTDGKIVRRAFDTGDGVSTTYWDSGNKNIESYGTNSGEWKKSIEYYDDTLGGIHYQWFENTETPDEIIFEERNLSNQIIRKQFDTGQTITTEYWDSGNKKLDAFSDANGIWQKGIEYWDTPSATMHYQWLADPDSVPDGDDLIFIEYDQNGNPIGGTYDNGEPWIPEGGIESIQTLDTEALARMELQSQQSQTSGTGSITFTSEMANQPKTQELLTL